MKKEFLGLDKEAWIKIFFLIIVFTGLIYLKLRAGTDTITPFDGIMSFWRP